LIVIGYDVFGIEILDTRVDPAETIFSDGCDTDAFHQVVRDHLRAIVSDDEDKPYPYGRWQLATPRVRFEDLGKDAFTALAQAGSNVLRWTSDHDARRCAFVELVMKVLEGTRYFRFEGIENVATPYQVRDLVREIAEDLRPAEEAPEELGDDSAA
jgi:hypothetical protein